MTLTRRKAISSGLAASLLLPATQLLGKSENHTSGPKGREVILGHGDFKYKQVPNWGVLNSKTPVKDCHEMVMDSKGRLIMLGNHIKNNVIIYDKSGKLLEKWGTDYPGAHGLTLATEGSEEFLFITDPERHQVYKTTLAGKLLTKLESPEATGVYPDPLQFKPTETAVAPDGSFYVADGYGKSYIIHYSAKGEVMGYFGGPGPDPQNLSQAHGIALDLRNPKEPCLLITDRTKNCLKRFTLDGKYLSTIELPGAYVCRPVVNGDNVYASVLISHEPWTSGTGFTIILDKNNKLVSAPGACEPVYEDGKLVKLYQCSNVFVHPHDVCVDNDKNLYIPQWNSGNTYPIKLERVG